MPHPPGFEFVSFLFNIDFTSNEIRLPLVAKATPISSSGKRDVAHFWPSSPTCPPQWCIRLLGLDYSRHGGRIFRGQIWARPPSRFESLLEQFSDIFPDALPAQLPPRRFMDYDIKIEEGSTPHSRPAYRLSKPGMEELQSQLGKLVQKGFIELSKSPCGAPAIFVKKADGSLRMVCDWRLLNRITTKLVCLPNIDDLFDTVQGSGYFTKLVLHSGNQIGIQDDDVAKTAINTPFGYYQFRVMGFGLTNAPANFPSLVNSILHPYLRKFAVVLF